MGSAEEESKAMKKSKMVRQMSKSYDQIKIKEDIEEE